MKVLPYFNFSKKINKIKYVSSMRNGRFHLPKCRSKVQNIWRGNSQMAFLKPPSCCPLFWVDVVNP
jgi:hypothetical protein